MTDSEFLNDVDRRCINGALLTADEHDRLRVLAGLLPVGCASVLRNTGRKHVREARIWLPQLVAARLAGSETIND